ncbi:MAG TPA: M15 family metallopeptidase [Baekduia sp.]|nr:M15 family metallopeptidase [Baekduia sp.]
MARNAALEHLHPAFRMRALALEARLAAEGIPLHRYEAARTPWRQAELYARGRTSGYGEFGKTVTRARAWESWHQYGLAADYVFRVDGKWTWAEPEAGMWHRYQQLAHDLDLQTLSREKPHVQLPARRSDLLAGKFPQGGDDSWEAWLEDQIERWGSTAREVAGVLHPGAPPLVSLYERPAEVA